MSVESTIKHLWECASSLNTTTHAAKLLKSYYLTTCQKVAKRNVQTDIKFPAGKMCPRCCSNWSTNDYKLKLHSTSLKNQKKLQNMLAAPIDEMSRTQRKRMKWLKKRTNSYVEICCEFCQNKTKVQLQKPSRKKVKLEVDKVMPEEENSVKLKKKVKKKKNKNKILRKQTCSETAIDTLKTNTLKKKNVAKPMEVVSTSLNKITTNEIQKIQKAKSKKTLAEKKQQSSAKSTPSLPPAQTVKKSSSKSTVPLPATQTIKKSKKQKNKKQSNANIVAIKAKAQTKQKNSLLKIAEMLKKQSEQPNTMQNRLKALLK